MPLVLQLASDEARVGNPFFKKLPPYNFLLSHYVADDENDEFPNSEKVTSKIYILFWRWQVQAYPNMIILLMILTKH